MHSLCIHVLLSSIVAHLAHPSSYALANGCGEEGSSLTTASLHLQVLVEVLALALVLHVGPVVAS